MLQEAHRENNTPLALLEPLERARFFEGLAALYALKGKQPPPKGIMPWQSAALVRDVRNALVHGKAEWASEEGNHAKLSKRITSAKLPLSPFVSDPESAFPLGCMSAGVAKWAADTAGAVLKQMNVDLGMSLWGLR